MSRVSRSLFLSSLDKQNTQPSVSRRLKYSNAWLGFYAVHQCSEQTRREGRGGGDTCEDKDLGVSWDAPYQVSRNERYVTKLKSHRQLRANISSTEALILFKEVPQKWAQSAEIISNVAWWPSIKRVRDGHIFIPHATFRLFYDKVGLAFPASLRDIFTCVCSSERTAGTKQPMRVGEEIRFNRCHAQQVPESSWSPVY